MGSLVQSPVYPRLTSACGFRVPPPSAADYRLPPLRSSFPSLLHPQYELVREQCDAWILGFVQPSSPAARRLLLDCLVPRLTCRNIPTASSLHRLIQVTKMVSWLIITDDEDDLPDALGADATAAAQSAARVMAVLRSHQDAAGPADAKMKHGDQVFHDVSKVSTSESESTIKTRALEALAELWGEMRIDMPPNLRARFISAMEDFLDAVKVQAAYRKSHRLPDVEAYTQIRRQASFILPCFSLVEYAVGIALDEDVYAHPQVQEFRNTAIDYMCVCNDIVSCRVEIGVGDYFNMPSILYSTCTKEQGCATFQEAIDCAASMAEQLDARLLSLAASIRQSSLTSLQHPFVKAYVAALGYSISGSLAWYLESTRYSNH